MKSDATGARVSGLEPIIVDFADAQGINRAIVAFAEHNHRIALGKISTEWKASLGTDDNAQTLLCPGSHFKTFRKNSPNRAFVDIAQAPHAVHAIQSASRG